MDGFDDVGFAEAVFADEDEGIGLAEIEVESLVVAEVFDLQF